MLDEDAQTSSDESVPASVASASRKGGRRRPLSFTFLGTGASSALPLISCTTVPEKACPACYDTLGNPESRNIRANTGAVIRVPQNDGGESTILLDCGKTFREAALKWFPKKGLRRIDACILTHLHADAIDGLDDLRAWTYKTAIERTIPIYCTKTTYDSIAAGFPYMVSKKAASGSGALPSFDWHIVPEDQDWNICGLTITPFPFHHGHYFDHIPPRPLICSAFLIDSSILYASDVSYIPEEQWARLGTYVSLPSQNGLFPAANPKTRRSIRPLPRLQAAILDVGGGLTSTPSSHMGLPHTIATARRLGALRTYLTDFGHGQAHETWLEWCIRFGRGETSGRLSAPSARVVPAWRSWTEGEAPPPVRHAAQATSGHDQREGPEFFIERAFESVEDWAGGFLPGRWVRPAFDGLTILCGRWNDGRSGFEWCDERIQEE